MYFKMRYKATFLLYEPNHIGHKGMVFLQYVVSYGISDAYSLWKSFHIDYTGMASPWHVFWDVF